MNTARRSLSFVTVEGNLLPLDILNKILSFDHSISGLTPVEYGLSEADHINEQINSAWQRMLRLWDSFDKQRKALASGEPGTKITKEKLLEPLFHCLDYGHLKNATAEERSILCTDGVKRDFPISYLSENAPIHVVGCNISLDQRTKGVQGAAQASPHAMVQDLLNQCGQYLWGFLSNGKTLRILRDNASMSRQAYIEFNLEGIFSNETFPDFCLLWLLCHATRVQPVEALGKSCWLETWMRLGETSSIAVLEDLSRKVEAAICIFGDGFLKTNPELRTRVESGALSMQNYYHQILRLVYRILFCFVAEERDLIHAPGTSAQARQLYHYYSVTRLRNLSINYNGSNHKDLYESFKLLMKCFSSPDGFAALGISPMGSFLWTDEAIPDLVRAKLNNRAMLKAIGTLSVSNYREFHGEKFVLRAVDFEHLGSRELGSVYESLLELHPFIDRKTGEFTLYHFAGNQRKKTGSYYTPSALISCLLDSALAPAIDAALRSKHPEARLLSLKICDPACGSGHFLTAASHRIAEALAKERSNGDEPSPSAVRKALRDVIGKCIYGVDINPMSVELCKLSLWMEAMEPGKPLAFLEHHVICGNSLLGATPEIIRNGLPDAAFTYLDGDDKKVLFGLKKRNQLERSRRTGSLLASDYEEAVAAIEALTCPTDFDTMPQDTLEQIEAKMAAFQDWKESENYKKKKLLYDMWPAAFLLNRISLDENHSITQDTIRSFARTGRIDSSLKKEIEQTSQDYQFVHWHIAFPEVTANGGFDVILGNPPWERIKIQEKEWFAERDLDIAEAINASERKKLIDQLATKKPALYKEFLLTLRVANGVSQYMRNTGLYPLCGRGDINLYAVFAEQMRKSVNENGLVGCIVPSGIATDTTTSLFFQDLVKTQSLISLFDFENQGIFQGVHKSFKFSLITMGSGKKPLSASADFVFFAHDTEEIKNPEKRLKLSSADIASLNPNTYTIPLFCTNKDAELTKALYRRAPVLINESEEKNPWQLSFGIMFNMASASSLFRTVDQLREEKGEQKGNIFLVKEKLGLGTGDKEFVQAGDWLPLYEAKMAHQFNHRWSSYKGMNVADVALSDLQNPAFSVLPRYWVHQKEVRKKLKNVGWDRNWLMGWRDITNNTNERTLISGIIPATAVGDSFLLLFSSLPYSLCASLISLLNSFIQDYIIRQKIGGTHIKYYYFKQLAVLDKEVLLSSPTWMKESIVSFITPRVLELTYTAYDMKPFAQDLGYEGEPFKWDEERRFQLRAELDALFFHLYLASDRDGSWKKAEKESSRQYFSLVATFPTPRDAVDYIMDTFKICKKRDEKAYGSYRTKEEILRVYDAMQEAMRTGKVYKSQLISQLT